MGRLVVAAGPSHAVATGTVVALEVVFHVAGANPEDGVGVVAETQGLDVGLGGSLARPVAPRPRLVKAVEPASRVRGAVAP